MRLVHHPEKRRRASFAVAMRTMSARDRTFSEGDTNGHGAECKQEYRTVRTRVVATFEPAVVILLKKGQHGNNVIDTQARNSTAVEIPWRDISGTSC